MDLKDSQIYFGRVPPNFAQTRYPGLQTSSLLGNLRGITTSNPGSNSLLNPLYNKPGRISPHCKVVPNCQNRIIKSVSFGGHGHVEVKSQPLRPFRSSASDLGALTSVVPCLIRTRPAVSMTQPMRPSWTSSKLVTCVKASALTSPCSIMSIRSSMYVGEGVRASVSLKYAPSNARRRARWSVFGSRRGSREARADPVPRKSSFPHIKRQKVDLSVHRVPNKSSFLHIKPQKYSINLSSSVRPFSHLFL